MIEIKNLSFSYPNRYRVFNDLSISIDKGGIYGLLGPNGQGKSTLLYLISGLLRPTSGSVTMNGTSTGKRLPSTLSEIFIVPEEFSLPAITMKEYCCINAPFYPKFSIDELTENLKAFGLDTDTNMASFSMGQKKKAFLSFALACNTSLLLLDEPTNGLDISSKADFRRFIASHMTEDRTIMVSTHQIHDVELLLDHIIMLGKDGQPVIDCPVSIITDKLCFETKANGNEPSATELFSRPTFGGSDIVSVRAAGLPETEINLELLYELAAAKPSVIKEILKTN
ncbi:MAG: ATP-binding cassette domain-containing protein [Muribaculaceae bacterium]|nr:ATP-binding cassette domain-containing protein [Muribaculaceae bacterium]